MTVTIGTWVIPLLVTIAAFWTAIWRMPSGGGGAYDFSGIIGCIYLPVAGCVSLAAWLAWALA